MTGEKWHLIPPDPRVEKTATADLSTADLWAELARIGNNWRDVNPRFADIVQRVVDEFGGGTAASQPAPTAYRAVPTFTSGRASDTAPDWLPNAETDATSEVIAVLAEEVKVLRRAVIAIAADRDAALASPQPLTVQDAARKLLDALKGGLDPFDCSVLEIEALAVKHAGNRGDAVIQLEIADEFFTAALRAIAEGRA